MLLCREQNNNNNNNNLLTSESIQTHYMYLQLQANYRQMGPGEGWPLFDVLADVESGDWVGAGRITQHQYEALAIW